MGFGTTIKDGSVWWGCAFFSFESGFESFFDEAFPDVGDGIGVAMKLFSNVAIVHSSVFVFVGGE